MPNHKLSPAKYQFYDSCHEPFMFRSETKIVEKVYCVKYIAKKICCIMLAQFATIFVSLRNIKRLFYESQN